MSTAATFAVAIVGIIHIAIGITEIFLWLQPKRYQKFGFDEKTAEKVYPIVKNAGLYNEFIAAGLCWAAFTNSDPFSLRVFFLICVIVAGIFGGITLKSWKAFIMQTVLGAFALVLVVAAHIQTSI